MVSRSTQSWQRWRQWLHPDQVRTGIGLRAGAVANLALDAFVQGRIDRVEVRDYLNLSLMDPLPEHPGLDDAQRAPLRHPQDRVRRVAQQYLQEVEDVWDCFATTVCTAEGGWRVEVARQTGDTLVPCGHILVSRDLSIARVEMEAGI
jgi:hypothetical protein